MTKDTKEKYLKIIGFILKYLFLLGLNFGLVFLAVVSYEEGEEIFSFAVAIVYFVYCRFVHGFRKSENKEKEEFRNEIVRLNTELKDVTSKSHSSFLGLMCWWNYKKHEIEEKSKELDELEQVRKNKITLREKELDELEQSLNVFRSNLKAIPYMSAIIADYETYGLEILAKQLDWGQSYERSKKVASIREIRKAAKEMAEKNLEAKYQLAYLLNLYPNLEDIIEMEYSQLPVVSFENATEYDKTRDWLSKEEYQILSNIEKNQLALDRYKNSHSKSKWQIGRDYELFVGYTYENKGYSVDYFGSYMGLEDLGRDLICKKGNQTLIIQCKYWSKEKVINEKHITQLYGTTVSYRIENGIKAQPILITNTTLSEQAKKMADYLKVKYIENFEKGDYPCIKCNIGKSEYGTAEYIYHLPFDQMYDCTKIDKPGEFMAMTVAEAENAGFRRAFRWFGG